MVNCDPPHADFRLYMSTSSEDPTSTEPAYSCPKKVLFFAKGQQFTSKEVFITIYSSTTVKMQLSVSFSGRPKPEKRTKVKEADSVECVPDFVGIQKARKLKACRKVDFVKSNKSGV